MKKQIYLLVWASLLLLLGCTVSHKNVVKKQKASFGVKELSEAWHKKSFRGADLFFEHDTKFASIAISSQCEKISDSPLEALTSQMMVGMGKYDIISEQRIKLSEREALVSEIMVNLDGVDRYLKIMVLRKNRCVFDAIYSAQEKTDLVNDFDDLVLSFWAEAEL